MPYKKRRVLKCKKWAVYSIDEDYDVRVKSQRFESPESARNESIKRTKILRASGNPKDLVIAEMLESCCTGEECWSAACPKCMRTFRIKLCAIEFKIFRDTADVRIITLIPWDRQVERFSLLNISLVDMKKALRAQVMRLGFSDAFIIGGFEVDFDETMQCWVPHFHLIVKGSDKESRQRFRRAYYPKKRAMKVQEVKDPAEQMSYCLKSYASRKTHYMSKKTGKLTTKKKRLHPTEANLALRFLAQYKPEELTFMRGVRRNGRKVQIRKNELWRDIIF